MENKEGLIYKVICLENDKVYIGKTKEFYGKKKQGAECRFKKHIRDALNYREDCPKFYNAIRKYGKKKFKIETILNCALEECDEYEQKYIAEYKSYDDKYGYNVALGGGGRSIVKVTDETRKKMSESRPNKTDNNIEPGICKEFRNGIHVGYCARIVDKQVISSKTFSSTKNTLDENLQLARDWLKDYKNGNLDEKNYKNYNKENDLPQKITYGKDKDGVINGYCVIVIINNKRYRKSFQESEYTLEKKFEMAQKWLKDFEDENIDKKTFGKQNGKNTGLPKNISEVKRNGEFIGYTAKIVIDKKKYQKHFVDMNHSKNEKLHITVKWLDDVKKGLIDWNKLKTQNSKNPNLEKNIGEIKIDKKIVGYYVKIKINKKNHIKQFANTINTPEKNYELALKYKQEILNAK